MESVLIRTSPLLLAAHAAFAVEGLTLAYASGCAASAGWAALMKADRSIGGDAIGRQTMQGIVVYYQDEMAFG